MYQHEFKSAFVCNADISNQKYLCSRFYVPLLLLLCFYLPTIVPVYLWNETYMNAFFISTMLRYIFTLNMTWLVNSAAHIWGNRPYDAYVFVLY